MDVVMLSKPFDLAWTARSKGRLCLHLLSKYDNLHVIGLNLFSLLIYDIGQDLPKMKT
jgi:hypothetical protein